VPLLFGLFWGAPLVAKELEEGTQDLVWVQGVTRRRWMTSNVSWTLIAAVLWGAAMSALVSWWRGPEDILKGGRFGVSFDITGLVPVAYTVFAVALGSRRDVDQAGTTGHGDHAGRVRPRSSGCRAMA